MRSIFPHYTLIGPGWVPLLADRVSSLLRFLSFLLTYGRSRSQPLAYVPVVCFSSNDIFLRASVPHSLPTIPRSSPLLWSPTLFDHSPPLRMAVFFCSIGISSFCPLTLILSLCLPSFFGHCALSLDVPAPQSVLNCSSISLLFL